MWRGGAGWRDLGGKDDRERVCQEIDGLTCAEEKC